MTSFLGLRYVNPISVASVDARQVVPVKGGLGRRVVGPTGQRWDVAVTLEPTSDLGALGLHHARHGLHTAFQIPMPQLVQGVPEELTQTGSSTW